MKYVLIPLNSHTMYQIEHWLREFKCVTRIVDDTFVNILHSKGITAFSKIII
jgi:hypothetical protein